MFVGIVFVISLASITSQVVGQLLNEEDRCAETDTSRSSPLNIQKRDVNKNERLFLTPYMESGKLEEARRRSEVTSDIFLGVKGYSGYLTVNKTYDSNLFFWYFPAFNDQPVHSTPWIIWLSGGPGTSSMFAVFQENGPFIINYETLTLERNNFTWCHNHSMVFIDSPVGTGFSFTNDDNGFAKDMETYALHLKIAVTQIMQIFPELSVAPLYVAGESYGGKYAPALAMELHKAKKQGLEVNLKGIITGNGYVDPSINADVPNAFHYAGLLSEEDIRNMLPLIEAYKKDNEANKSIDAVKKLGEIYYAYIMFSGLNPYNLHDFEPNFDETYFKYALFLQNVDVRAALHVGDTPFADNGNNDTVLIMLMGEFITSARPLYEELLNNNYTVLAYCGMLDMMLPCYLESEEYRKWRWSRAHEFINATRAILYTRADWRAGYLKSGGGFTEVQIRSAGHYVPIDQPRAIYELVADMTHGGVPLRYLQPIEDLDNNNQGSGLLGALQYISIEKALINFWNFRNSTFWSMGVSGEFIMNLA